MRLKIAIATFLFLCFQSYSQNEEWYTYDLDSIVSLNFYGDVYESDTIANNLKIDIIFTESDSLSFYARKIGIGKEFYQLYGVQHPVKDQKTLITFYQTFALTVSETRDQENSISRPINFGKLKGYRFVLDATEDHPYMENQVVFLNDHLYAFQYITSKGLDSIQRNNFFNSIHFDDTFELNQFPKKRSVLNGTTVGVLIAFLLLSFYLKQKNRRRSRE